MYVNCQGALAIKIWPGIFILKNCEVHQNQKNGTKQPNGYILSAYKLPDRFIPSALMDWLDRYTTKRINQLKQQNIKNTWRNLYLQKAVDDISKQQQS